MKNIISLSLILSAFWLLSSGFLLPLILALGALSIMFIVWMMQRVDAMDGIRYPVIMFSWRLPGYLLWLLAEIIKSNLAVVRCIWFPSTISPTVTSIKSDLKGDAARALYANSITLTPGTVTLAVNDGTFEVHALTKSGAEDLKKGDMGRRVRRLEA